MTITTYYYTFGFLVRIEDCLPIFGFTFEKFNENIRKEIIDNAGYDEDDTAEFTEERWLKEWFELECKDGFQLTKTFELDGMTFSVRGFMHNDDKHDRFLVVGIDIGEMGRFNGVYKQTLQSDEKPKHLLSKLAQNEEWKKAVQRAENQQSWTSGRAEKKNYLVPSLQFNSLSVAPSIYTTTDDCDCCS